MRTATVLRKVGAPPGKVLANSQSGRPAGKCHREQTADGPRAQVRVKRCGKSAPASGVTSMARQTPPGARPNVGDERPVRQSPGTDTPLVGRIDGWSPRRREALDRTPPTGRLTIARIASTARRMMISTTLRPASNHLTLPKIIDAGAWATQTNQVDGSTMTMCPRVSPRRLGSTELL